jgi:hypothetical protein
LLEPHHLLPDWAGFSNCQGTRDQYIQNKKSFQYTPHKQTQLIATWQSNCKKDTKFHIYCYNKYQARQI